MKKEKGNALLSLIGILFVLAAVIAVGYGYVMNIVKLFRLENAGDHIGELIIRIVGIFTGIIGAIAGYF